MQECLFINKVLIHPATAKVSAYTVGASLKETPEPQNSSIDSKKAKT
jgi:hypothetical protein